MTPQEYRAKQNQLTAMTNERLVHELDRLATISGGIRDGRIELRLIVVEVAKRLAPEMYADLENEVGIHAGIRE